MKSLKRISLIYFLTGFLGITLMASSETSTEPGNSKPEEKEITWNAYDDGLIKAAEGNKQVFVNFTAKWCGYCRKMDREVFTDPGVIEMLNDHFISVKVDGESKNELDIDGYKTTEKNLTVREFGVRGFPTFWFLESDGAKIGPLGGYVTTETMLEVLTYVQERRYDSTQTEVDSSKQ